MKTQSQTPSPPSHQTQTRTVTGCLAGIVAAAMLSTLPTRADGVAAITFGLPHAQITVASTWDDDHRQIMTAETPAVDYDAGQPVVVESEAVPTPATVVYVDQPYRVLRVVHGRRTWVVEHRSVRREVVSHPAMVRHDEGWHGNQADFARGDIRNQAPAHTTVRGHAAPTVNPRNHQQASHTASAATNRVGNSTPGHGAPNLYPTSSGRPAPERGVQR